MKVYGTMDDICSSEMIELNKDDLIVFRGDLVHAGTASVNGHFGRLHAYLDSEMVKHDSTSELVDIEKDAWLRSTIIS